MHVHHGRERLKGSAFARAARASDLVVTTYALALRDRETLAPIEWERIVLDEAQNIKTSEAKQTRAIRSLPARHRVALTGTPVENRLTELHSIMDFLNPGLLGSAGDVPASCYATPIERWRDGDATARLRRATGPFILRRLKTDKEIIGDLPEKIEMRVDCHLTSEQATLYQAVVDEMLEKADARRGDRALGDHPRGADEAQAGLQPPGAPAQGPLRTWTGARASSPGSRRSSRRRSPRATRRCASRSSPSSGTCSARHLQERLGREVLFLHGGHAEGRARRDGRSGSRPSGGPPLFVLSLKAGGTGLNLTAANHVIHFDRWWNPAVEDQATDRAFRIGQRKNVQVRKLTCVGTLEERIDQLIAREEGSRRADRRHRRGVAHRARHRAAARAGRPSPATRWRRR